MELVVFTLLLTSLVSAFGVSSDYWRGNPLKISAGETKTISLRLQNIIGAEDITVRAVLVDGKEIASVREGDYLVKLGTKDTEVPITISIPENFIEGSEHLVTVSFITVTPSGEGAITLGTGVDTSFDVLVVPFVPVVVAEELQLAPKEGRSFIVWIIAGIILLIIIIIIIIKRKRKKQVDN